MTCLCSRIQAETRRRKAPAPSPGPPVVSFAACRASPARCHSLIASNAVVVICTVSTGTSRLVRIPDQGVTGGCGGKSPILTSPLESNEAAACGRNARKPKSPGSGRGFEWGRGNPLSLPLQRQSDSAAVRLAQGPARWAHRAVLLSLARLASSKILQRMDTCSSAAPHA